MRSLPEENLRKEILKNPLGCTCSVSSSALFALFSSVSAIAPVLVAFMSDKTVTSIPFLQWIQSPKEPKRSPRHHLLWRQRGFVDCLNLCSALCFVHGQIILEIRTSAEKPCQEQAAYLYRSGFPHTQYMLTQSRRDHL